MKEREVVGALPLVTNDQAAEEIVPAIGPLDDPAARFSAHAADKGLFSSPADVRDDASVADFAFGVRVVEALVQAEVLGSTRPSWRAKHDGVERRARHPLVVDVRASDLDGYRDAARIGQNVAFCAEFCAIGRIGARMVPPFGAFTLALSSEHHFKSTPTRSS
jgi:hypothetical protein